MTVTEHDQPASLTGTKPESLASLLGGGRAALDATLPVIAFTCGWLLTDLSVPGSTIGGPRRPNTCALW
jgi:hypothetical protein